MQAMRERGARKMKIQKIWEIHTDLHIGSTANAFVMVQNDQFSYALSVKFVRNRRALSMQEELTGKIFLRFFLPQREEWVELVDIEYDEGTFPIPNSYLLHAGSASVQIEEWDGGNLINNPNPLDFIILESPWGGLI